MKSNWKAIVYGWTGVAALLLLGACVANPDSSGLEYMPDMYRSPAIEPYVDYAEVRGRANEDQKLVQSALTPPANTIPYYGTNGEEVKLMLPYFRKASVAFRETHGLYGMDLSTADEYTLAVNDKNPYVLTAENQEQMFKTGKELYTAYCMHCHGEKGDGNGPMVASGAYNGVPNYKDRANLSDGQIFYSIYYGKGAMGAHASIVNKKEIWTLVHYVRKFQDENYGPGGMTASTAAADSTAQN